MGPGEADILPAAVGDNLGVAAEGSLGAVEDSSGAVEVDIDPAADNLEEGPRSSAVVEDTLVEDIGSAEVAGSHLKSASKLLWWGQRRRSGFTWRASVRRVGHNLRRKLQR